MNTFNYNSSTVNYYTTQDLGSIGDALSSTVDSGVVSSAPSSTATYGDVVFTETVYPYGSIKFSSNTTESASVKFITVGIIKLETAYVVKYRSAWVGSGSLFEIAGGKERIIAPWIGSSGPLRITGSSTSLCTYEYNDSAVVEYSSDDYGNVSSTITSSVNHGEISILASGEENLGAIFISNTVRPYGNFNLIGESSVIYKPSFAWRGSGSLFGISNAAKAFSAQTPENTFLYKFLGSATEKNTENFIGSGSLFHIGDKVERATYSYNQSSIELYNPEQDYGSITASGTTIDLGFINQSISNGEVDYGLINLSDIDYPLNVLFNISGESANSYKPSFAWRGSGSLFEFNGTTEAFSANTPENTFLYNVSGNATDSRSKIFIGSGSLFHIGDRVERATYSYNQSSIELYNLEQDYGSITASGTTIDLGYVNQIAVDGEINYGLINLSDIDYPLNVLFNISGRALSEYRPVFTQIGSGSLKFHHEPNPSDTRFIPWWRGRGGASIFNSIIPDAFSRPYIGSGSLFSFGNKNESATYNYNTSSIEFFISEDYGVITSSGIVVDYGHVSESNVGITDYSSIVNLDVDYPLNLLYSLTGEGVGQFIRGPYVGKGNVFTSGLAIEKQTDDWAGTGFVYVSGTVIEKNTESYTASGSLFNIGDKVERATYSYNSSSVSGYDELDYGLVTASGTTLDNGLITQVSSGGEVDYGNLIDLDITLPHGLFKINGVSDTRWIQVFTKVGSGSLFEFNGTTEAFSAQTPENTFLYNVSGNATDSRNRTFIGSGSLFNIGDRVERATYSYNSSSVSDYDELDYGLVTVSGTTIDLGYVTQPAVDGEINYGNVIDLDITSPYGLFKFSGQSTARWIQVFTKVGSGSLFELKGATEAFSAQTPENTFLYNVSGNATDSRSKIFIGSGSLFEIGDRVERATYSYNQSSIVVYETEIDYGSVTTSGSITNLGYVNQILTNGEVDYGSIILYDYDYPVNVLFQFTGEAFTEYKPSFTWRGRGGLTFTHEPNPSDTRFIPWWRGRGGASIFNSIIPDAFSRPYIGSGSLFHIGDKVERATYSYNSSSVSGYDELDYGLVTASGNTIDNGLITQISSSGEINYGNVIDLDITSPFGLFKINGVSDNRWIQVFTKVGSGSLFEFKGATEAFSANTPENTFLYNVSGNANDSRSKIFIGSGSLFHIGDKVERATYSYNSSSVSGYDELDYGLVTVSGTTIDLGHVNQTAVDGEIDYGNVIDLDITLPYGLFKFSGQSTNRWIQVFTKVGSGSLFEFNGTTEAFSAQTPENTFLYNVSGNANDSRSKIFIGSGSLFEIGDRVERATYSYNSSSVSDYDGLDYGLVTVSGTTIDLGYVTQPAVDGEIDYGLINVSDIDYPVNVLFQFTGEAFTEYKPSFTWRGRGGLTFTHQPAPTDTRFIPWWRGQGGASIFNSIIPDAFGRPYIGSGSLFSIGDKVERATYSYNSSSVSLDYDLFSIYGAADNRWIQVFTKVGSGSLFEFKGATEAFSAQTPENTLLYNVSGNATDSRNRTFIGSGSLFHIGDKVERATYSYNQSSVSGYDELDYGLVTASGTTVDNGYVNQTAVDGEINYGNVIDLDITYPYGLFSIYGASTNRWIQVFTKVGSGSLFEFNGTTEAFSANTPENTFLYNVSGNATDSRNRTFIGSGSLFHIGDKVERATYSYNQSSIVVYETEIDYGLVTVSGTTIDNGLITQISSSGEIDYGNVIDLDITSPYGLFSIYGASTNRWIQVFTKVGSGSLFEFKGATEAFSANTPENTFLYNVSGNATDSRNRTFIGSGSLFHIGDKVERATYSYNSSSVSLDYDLFSIYGAAGTPFRRSYDGSGTLSAYTGTAEAFSAQTPENTFLYAFSGSAKTPRTKQFVTSGDALLITGYITEKNTESYVGTGNINVIGDSDADRTKAYSGSGNITLSTGKFPEFRNYRPSPRYVNSVYGNIGGELVVSGAATEAFSAQTPENTFLYAFSGSIVERQTDSWNGTGNINVIGDSDADRTKAYSGIGTFSILKGTAEAFSAQTPENTFLYAFSGSATEKNTENFIGSGSAFSVGASTVTSLISAPQNTVLFDVYGTAVPAITLSHYGSGSLFSYRESTSSVTFNPVENTALYQISGSGTFKKSDKHNGSGQIDITGTLVERNTENYLGTGNIFAIGESNSAVVFNPVENIGLFNVYGSAVESNTERYIGTGSAEISGIAIEKNTENYVGTGTLLSFVQSESKVSFNPPATALFRFNGSAIEKNTERYIGTGLLFTFDSSSQSVTFDIPSEIQLFSFSGSAIEKNTERYIGTGNIFTIGIKVESRTVFERSSGNINITGYIEEKYSKAPYQGSGSLFTFKGATESKTSNPPEETVLFKFTGSVVEKNTENYVGTGSARISGNVTDRFVKSYVGEGNISFANNAAIISFVSQTPENTILFKFGGESRFRYISRYLGSGTEFISDVVIEKQTDSYRGKGSLFEIGNASASKLVIEKTDTRTSLFKISGGERNNYSRISIINKFNIEISGTSKNIAVIFTPTRIFGGII